MTALNETAPLSAERLAEIRRNEAEVADYISSGLMRSNSAYQDRTDLLAEVDRLNTVVESLNDAVNGVGCLSAGLPDSEEVARLRQAVNAYQDTIDRVATVPSAFKKMLGDKAIEDYIRRSDLNVALGLTPDGKGVA